MIMQPFGFVCAVEPKELTFLYTSFCRRKSSGRASNSLFVCSEPGTPMPLAHAKAKYTSITWRAGNGNQRHKNVLSA